MSQNTISRSRDGAETRDIIAVAGDWHGNGNWAGSRVLSLGARGITTLLHVGDFGIWPGPTGKRFLHGIETAASRFGVTILVTPGNHDDWGRFTSMWDAPSRRHRDADGTRLPLQLTEHVSVLPRGHRWQIAGRTFVSLGGAPSIDFISSQRVLGRNWWAEEMIQPDDVSRTVAGGYADVMVAHDAPGAPYQTPGVRHIVEHNDFGWSDRELAYAAIGTERLTEAFVGVAPRLLVHGHLHTGSEATFRLPGKGYDTTIWSLDRENSARNVRLLDLATLQDPGAGS